MYCVLHVWSHNIGAGMEGIYDPLTLTTIIGTDHDA